MEWKEGERAATHLEFMSKYPQYTGLTVEQKRKVLDGELVPVRCKRGFVLMTKENMKPGGKLDQHNTKVRAINAHIRRDRRQRRSAFAVEFMQIMGGLVK